MEKITAIKAKAIIKKSGLEIVCRKLSECKSKKEHLQIFAEDWCGLRLVYYVFDLQNKTLRKGNYFNIDNKKSFRYYKDFLIDISNF